MFTRLTRREFLKDLAIVAGGAALAGCAPQVVKETVIVEKPVEKIVKEVVKETVIVEGTPQVVEKVVEKVVTAPPAEVRIPERIEITIAKNESPWHPLRNDTPAHVAITERLGIQMRILKLAGEEDWKTKQKVWLATNQVPDLLKCDKGDIRDYAPQGPLLSLGPMIEAHAPHLQQYVRDNADVIGKFNIGGQMYYTPGFKYNWKLNSPMPMIRLDLLDKLGLEAPTDYDELFDVLTEFKAAYPDTVGFTCRLGTRRLLEYALYPMGSGFPLYYEVASGCSAQSTRSSNSDWIGWPGHTRRVTWTLTSLPRRQPSGRRRTPVGREPSTTTT